MTAAALARRGPGSVKLAAMTRTCSRSPLTMAALAAALAVSVGCTETRTYSFALRNGLDRPVRVCLTKSAGPFEPDWESPEQAAGPSHPASYERPPGFVLPPGKTGSERDVPGTFYRDRGFAVLRVYAGTPSLDRMAATDHGSPDRVDYPLDEGPNNLVLTQSEDGQLHVDPIGGG